MKTNAPSFERFEQVVIRNRAGHLLDVIERAMGKAVSGRDADEVIGDFGGPIHVSGNSAEPLVAII